MAQAKVKDFFSSKKRQDTDHQQHAAKRRKIQAQPSISIQREVKLENTTVSLSVSRPKTKENNLFQFNGQEKDQHSSASLQNNRKTPSSSSKSTSRRSTKSSRLVVRARTNKNQETSSQKKLTDLFSTKIITDNKEDNSDSSNLSSEVEEKSDGNSNCKMPDSESFPSLGKSDSSCTEPDVVLTEVVTSFSDDHRSFVEKAGLQTPRKRTIDIESDGTSQDLSRKNKTAMRKSNIKNGDLEDSCSKGKLHIAKKKLDLEKETNLKEATNCQDPEKIEEVTPVVTKTPVKEVMDKSHLMDLVADVASPPIALSPLPVTPERIESSPSPEPATPKLKDLSQKLKALSKMNGQALKNRLKQSGKLKDVKEKSYELGAALTDSKSRLASGDTVVEENKEKESEQSLPAYQRFDHLTAEGVPTLALPFHYRLIENTFHAMDTVVSMMHNRSEMCTFSKLKAAVQNMTKKNFEEKAVGQIKTVLPDAYVFRQETNIPVFGNKKSNTYQLTIEANLPENDKLSSGHIQQKNSEGKPIFSASLLLHRKRSFKNNLIARVKEMHRKFLSGLSPPIKVSDDKLTRWHPLFQLDKVPGIPPAPLPQPPEVKVYHSAKDVLEKQKGKLNPRVEAALSKVALNSEKESQAAIPAKSTTITTEVSKATSSVATTSSLKGIPPALLAKIRAKEAAKMQEALTRDPAEDNKTKMMSHLPEMIRIIRSYFITERKPALLLEKVYKKLEDSYRLGISRRDVEQHIHLLKELAPELVTVVEIKNGKYMKLDKNVNTQEISNRILNLVKSRE